MGQTALLVGALTGTAALKAAVESSAAREQKRLSDRAASFNLAQQQTAIADRRALAAKTMRQRMAEQMALASRRGGSSSLAAQFAATSQQNYGDDMRALTNQQRAAELNYKNALESSALRVKAARYAGFGDILSAGVDAYAFSAFGNSGATEKVTK